MSRVLGRDFSYVRTRPSRRPTPPGRRTAPPDWQVDAWVSTYTAIAAGELAAVTGDVALLTGRPATSLEDLLAAGA